MGRTAGEMVWVCIEGHLKTVTEKAVLFIDADSEEVWVPKSVLERIEYLTGGDSRDIRLGEAVETIEVHRWWAQNEGYESADDD